MPESAPETDAKKGWFTSMVDKMMGAEEPSEDVPMEQVQTSHVGDTTADLKELARISLAVMKRMPGDMISEFKQTSDYDAFKDILRRHKLIK